MEANRLVRRRGPHIFYTVGSEMAGKLSALRAVSALPPETDNRGQQACETSRFPHFLYSRLRDGRDIVSLTRRQRFTP
jgi:hypothetical protein